MKVTSTTAAFSSRFFKTKMLKAVLDCINLKRGNAFFNIILLLFFDYAERKQCLIRD